MAGYLGSRPVVVQVDGYQRTEAESRYVNVSGDDFTGHLDFTDDAKARFGSSDEMHIYTESSGNGYSYIQGDNIVIRKADQSTNYLTALGGVVTLCQTTFTGDVTINHGSGATTGVLTLGNHNGNGTLAQLNMGHSGDTDHGNISYTGSMIFKTGGNATALTLDGSQDATFTGTVAVGGSTVTDGNMLNIQGDGSAVNVGAVFNKTNSTAQIWSWQVNNSTNDFRIHNYTASTSPLIISTAGNVGIGCIPEAWHSDYDALQIGGGGAIWSHATGGGNASLFIGQNVYHDGAWNYINANEANNLQLKNGEFYFNQAASGSADGTISFSTALTIDSSGNVGIGQAPASSSDNFTVLGNYKANFIRNYSSSNRGYDINIGAVDGSGNHIIGGQIIGEVFSGDATGALAFGTRIGGSVTEKMRINQNGQVGLNVSPLDATTGTGTGAALGAGFSTLVIKAHDTRTQALSIDATNANGPNFMISSYSDGSGSYYMLGANLQLDTAGNVAWETNGENMSGIQLDSRGGQGIQFLTAKHDGSSYVPAERMRIDNNGRTIFGYTSGRVPVSVLVPHSNAAVANAMRISTYGVGGYSSSNSSNAGAKLQFGQYDDGYDWVTGSIASTRTGGNWGGGLIFYTNNNSASANETERMRIHSNGNVKIGENAGTLNDNCPLQIEREESSNDSCVRTKNPSTNSRYHFDFWNSSGTQGNITVNSGSVSYNSTSDYRKKENVNYDWDGTTELKKLKPAKFNFIGDSDTIQGFLAHEVSDVVPIAVTGEKDAVNEDSEPIYQSMDASKLVPLLVKTIQELEARIATLEGS